MKMSFFGPFSGGASIFSLMSHVIDFTQSGSSATVCEWSGWTKDFLLIESLSDFVNIYDELQTGEKGNVSSSILAFTPEKGDDGKFLSCRARNELIQNTAVEDQWQITVYCEYLTN